MWSKSSSITAVKAAERFRQYERFQYRGSPLHLNYQYRIGSQKFAYIKCVFAVKAIGLINFPLKRSLRQENIFWKRKVSVFYVWNHLTWAVTVQKENLSLFKGMHNSAVGENKSKQGKTKREVSDPEIRNVTGETSTNWSLNLGSILLQTPEIVFENPFNKKGTSGSRSSA